MASPRESVGAPEKVSWSALESSVGEATLTPIQRLGYGMFKWMIGVLGALVLVLALYGFLTWPRIREIHLPADATATDYSQAVRDLRADWYDQMRQAAQLYVVGPVIPIVSAIVGYLLGNGGESESS